MNSIKKGSIVYRKSQSKDVIFTVEKIIKKPNDKVAVLKGLIERVLTYSPLDDLEIVDKKFAFEKFSKLDRKINERINNFYNLKNGVDFKKNYENKRFQETLITGKILHLDGDSCLDNKTFPLT